MGMVKNKKNARQISKCSLDMHAQPLVSTLG